MPHPIERLLIRSLIKSDSIEELTSLLHSAYKQLADMNLKYLATRQTVEQTIERIGKGNCLIAILNNEIVGTITYHSPGYFKKDYGFLSKPTVSHIQQLGIKPEFQRLGIGSQLIAKTEQLAREDNSIELALDTAEQAKHLINWYNKIGYRFVEYVNWGITNYRSVVLSKQL